MSQIDARAAVRRIAKVHSDFASTADRFCMVRVSQTMLTHQAEELTKVGHVLDELIVTLRTSRGVIATALRAAAPDVYVTDVDIDGHLQIQRIDVALQHAGAAL